LFITLKVIIPTIDFMYDDNGIRRLSTVPGDTVNWEFAFGYRKKRANRHTSVFLAIFWGDGGG
jgi:hypothetical protein